MIRAARPSDKKKIMDLWLQGNLVAHSFIAADFWYESYDLVAETYLPAAETFVFEDKHRLKGFISLVDKNYIGALFVAPSFQGQKVGSKLLRYVQRHLPHLCLNVYAANRRALRFYQKSGFKIVNEQVDPQTQEKELLMAWGMACLSGFKKRCSGDS